jgi:hypothetical protein
MSTSSLKIVIVSQTGQRFLVNTSARTVRRLVLSLGYWHDDWDGTSFVEPTDPHYELDDIPAQSHVLLGDVDPEEEGVAWWRADDLVWEDGSSEQEAALQEQEYWDEDELPGKRVELPVLPMDLIG